MKLTKRLDDALKPLDKAVKKTGMIKSVKQPKKSKQSKEDNAKEAERYYDTKFGIWIDGAKDKNKKLKK